MSGVKRSTGTTDGCAWSRFRSLLACGLAVFFWLTSVAMTQTGNSIEAGQAIRSGELQTLHAFLDDDLPIESRDRSGRTLLLQAVHADQVDIARLLIDRGASVNAKDAIDDTPFLYASAEGRLKILNLILDAGPDLSDTNRFGGTGLIPAAHHGHVETVRRLLETKIDIDHVNKLGWTALLEAVILGDGGPSYLEIVRLLIEAGADSTIADRDGVTALEHAQRRGFDQIANLLER